MLIKTISLYSMVPRSIIQLNLYRSVPVQQVIKSSRFFGLAQMKDQIFISERRFSIYSYQSRIFHKQSWVILTRSENEKMICSAELESYQKRTLPSLSVTNELPNKTEIQKMSNLRNLFCMVAINLLNSLEIIKNPSQFHFLLVFTRILNRLIEIPDGEIQNLTFSILFWNLKCRIS